jgi:hypothetical protein
VSKETLIRLILSLIILILLAVIFWRDPAYNITVEPFDDTALRDSIKMQELLIEKYEVQIELSMNKIDSLENLKPKIQHHYHEIYKTLPHATNAQLDSILRASW